MMVICTQLYDFNNSESLQENDAHNLVLTFEIQTDHLISTRRIDLVIVNQKKNEKVSNSELCRPSGLQSKIKRKRKREKYLDFSPQN